MNGSNDGKGQQSAAADPAAGIDVLMVDDQPMLGETVRRQPPPDAGRINVSRQVEERVTARWHCEPRGTLPVKTREPLEMFFVNGPR
ncbi:MAG TPA: hypothetical protein VHE37_13390 [Nevskiaceae bacterium]|nr:hypothetical protein [Nevskiaceae bacterium]